MGASLDVTTGRDTTVLGLRVLKKDLDRGLDLLMETVMKPAFPAEELQREIGQTLAAIQSEEEVPQAVAGKAFQKTLAVRKLNSEAKELADMYFLETFVRLHRAGEGAPYTGIKPAGTELGPAVEAADKALESGSADNLLKLMTETVVHGIREHYERTMTLKKHAGHSVEAGREFAEAYVKYVHYVEKLYDDATAKTAHHGHAAEAVKHEH